MKTKTAATGMIAILLLSIGLCVAQELQPSKIGLIPWPRELKVSNTNLELNAQSRIIFATDTLRPLAKVLRQEIYQISGLKLALASTSAGPGDILLKLSPSLAGETHTLKIDKRVEISGSNYSNTAMASVSLLQAIDVKENRVTLPRMSMKDWPHSSYRSLLVDTARQVHTIDTLKQCVVLCRLYKIRYLQLHLSDDQSFTFESKAFPKLATPGRHFTQAEYKDLVAFSDARGVTLVPELDAPGHTTAMRKAMPELFGESRLSVINIGKEETLLAMETLIEELTSVFHSSPYFHIGADEAWFANLEKDEDAKKMIREKGYDNVHDLFYNYIVRMHNKVKQLGRKTVMWESFSGTGSRHVEIPRDILVMAWETAYQLPQSLLENDYNIVNVSWKPSYLTPGWRWDPEYIYGWNMFRWENHWKVAPSYSPIQIKPRPNNRITGGMMCSWESSDEMEIPGIRLRLPALSERIWTPDGKLPYEHFSKRFAHTDQVLQKLIRPVAIEAEGLRDPNYIGPFYNRENHFGQQLKIAMRPMVPGAKVHYTLDKTVPTQASPQYERPIVIDKTTTLRAQVYDAKGEKLSFISTTPYEHHPITGEVDGLLMQVRHDNGRGKHRTQFGKQVTITLRSAMNDGTIRYTTNGQSPNAQSPVYSAPIILKKSGTITARNFNREGRPQGETWRRSFNQLDAETNLTTGKPVTASSVAAPSTPPELAVDSIVDKEFHWDGSAGAPQWWQVDLEGSHKLNKVQVITYWDERRYYQYRVEVSLDGATWSEVADFSQNTQVATSKGFTHEFEPIIARHIRVTMLYNSANPGLHLVEVRAFAEGK